MLYMEPLLKLDDFSVKLHTSEHVDRFIYQEDLTTKKKNS